MALVFFKCLRVGLNGFSFFQKENAHGVAWNAADQSLRVFHHAADTPVQVGGVNRPFGRKRLKFFRRKALCRVMSASISSGDSPGKRPTAAQITAPSGRMFS